MSTAITVNAKGLEALLGYKMESTILKDVRRNPKKGVPPFIKVGKGTIWFRQVALNWMAGEPCDSIEIIMTATYLTATDLAEILIVKQESSILRDVSRNTSSLPPITRHGKKPVWLLLDVLKWLADRSSEPVEIIFTSAKDYHSDFPSIAEMLLSQAGK